MLFNAALLRQRPHDVAGRDRGLGRRDARALAGGGRRLVERVEGNRYAALYSLAIATEKRQGEMLALAWKNADPNRGSCESGGPS